MFVFKIKDNSAAIDIVVTRALLALGGIIALIYRTDDDLAVSIIIAAILFSLSLFIDILLIRFRVNKLLLTAIAAALLFIATHSFAFAAVLILYAVAVKLLYKQPVVHVSKEGLELKKMIGSNHHEWSSFVNVVLKDRLLTMDFKSNKLLQLDIEEATGITDEAAFNFFCRQCLSGNGR